MVTLSNIKFNRKHYPTRVIELDGFGSVLISTSALNDKLLTTSGAYSSKVAQYIDEKIFYFVDDDEITLCEDRISSLILSQVL